MKRQPFTSYILEKNLLPREKYKIKKVSGSNGIKTIVNDALSIAHENFRSGISTKNFNLHGKAVYSTNCIKEKIILRHCANNLHQAMGLNLIQRNVIIEELKIYLREGSRFRIYRLDIKNFFESIDISILIGKIENNTMISRHTRNLVEWYLKLCALKFNNPGLPRGLEISPILSEIYLIEFDKIIKRCCDCIYYNRFVDDIIIITKGNEEEASFLKFIDNSLPEGLKLNTNKYKKNISPIIEARKQGTKTHGTELHTFDFLGYEFKIIDSYVPGNGKNIYKPVYRTLKINFSKKRIKKFKTKISKAFYSYNANGNFRLLSDRLKFLTSNRNIKRQMKGLNNSLKQTISTGIFYSNSKLDTDSPHLKELDDFIFFCIKNTSARLNKRRKKQLTKQQKKNLLRNSFRSGFNKKIHIAFTFKRSSEITKIWL